MPNRNETKYYVYILSNKLHTVFYTGVTSNLVKRIYEHKEKLVEGFTKRYNVAKLIYFEECSKAELALNREKQVKDYRREKKKELITSFNPSWKDL